MEKKRMITKNNKVKKQIHLYSNPKLYNEFKENVKQLNKTTDNIIKIKTKDI